MNMDGPSLEKKWVDTGRGKVFYFINRRHSGRPTVVFLHGLSSNHTTWVKIAGELDRENINSILVEQRGHGFSDKSKIRSLYNVDRLSADLALIIRAEGLGPFYLVGYSFGGTIAIDFVIKHPQAVRAMILISANHANPLIYKKLGWLTWPALALAELLSWLLIWQKLNNYHYYDHSAASTYWRSVWRGLRTMPLSINLWMLELFARIDYRNQIGQITIPVKILCSNHDPYISKKEIREMAGKMPDVEIIVSRNHSHFIATKSQDEVGEIIIATINKYENSHLH
jgi:2-succinyl-6-hydroxy-2,4-cyclohexadiene-1-carboxylate synthase